MSQIERFFHLRQGPKGGATVRVVGDTDVVGHVFVQFARCSKKDAFCKATGRSLAVNKPAEYVALRYLPAALERIAKKEVGTQHPHDYSFAVKYFLPKE